MIRNVLSLAVLMAVHGAHAQSAEAWQKFKDMFPDEAAVYVNRSETLYINVEGDSLRSYIDVQEEMLCLKDQGDALSGRRVYGSTFNEVSNLRAKTLVWDKNRYREMNVAEFKKNSDRSAGIFYDDSYYYAFNFPAVAARSRTQLAYRENIKDPRFISGYIFASYLPQAHCSFAVKTPKGVELHYEVVNDDKQAVQFKKTEKGNVVTYEWTVRNLPALKRDDGSPSLRYYAPHVLCYVKSYPTRKGTATLLSNLDDLYRWYHSFVATLNKEHSPALQAIVKDLQKESTTELDLVKNVFYWVQDNIQYIAFEQGMRGLIPNSGAYVCEKRYGDCKDMANLIVNMLQLAGVKAYHTWIGTRDLPYKYTALPTPLVDNHMIATYIAADGAYYFLDATSDHTPFGFPSSMIQGKEALIGFDATRYEVKTVPVVPQEKNVMTDSMVIRMNGNTLEGNGTGTLQGYPKVFAGYELDRAERDDVKRYVTRLIGKGSNKFYLDNYTLAAVEDRDKPTRVDYQFRIADYFQKLGDEIYINLNLNKEFYNDLINVATRHTPRELDYVYQKAEVIELPLPEGYTVAYLPPDVHHQGKVMGFDMAYKQLPGKVVFRKEIYVAYLLLLPSEFAAWNESVKLASDAYKESIILKKKKP